MTKVYEKVYTSQQIVVGAEARSMNLTEAETEAYLNEKKHINEPVGTG